MNKKGYISTPILILLILSSATFMVSFVNVKNGMVTAKNTAFVSVAKTYLNAAITWKLYEDFNGNDSNCVTLETLRETYVENEVKYDGYIEFELNKPKIYITDGKYMIDGKTEDELSSLDSSALKPSTVEFMIPDYCK